MKSNNLVIISEQAYQQINRKIYDLLKKKVQKLKIVIPYDSSMAPPSKLESMYIPRPIKNYHPRKSFSLLPKKNFLLNSKVDSILLESDFHTLTCLQVLFFKVLLKRKYKVSLLTFENIKKDYLLLAVDDLRNFKLKRSTLHYFMYLMERFLGRYIDNIFTVSKDSTLIYKQKFKLSKICQIPLGIDSDRFNMKNRQKTHGLVTLAYMGRVIKEKNPHLVLDAFERLSADFKNICLIFQDPIRYDSDYAKCIEKRLNKLKQKGLAIKVVNPSHIEMPHHLKQVDILITPSTETELFKEQYGRIIVEGKLCGAIVLSSYSGAFPEINGFYDQLFKPTPKDLYNRVKEFIKLKINNPDKFAARIEKSYKHAVSKQTLKPQLIRYIENLV